MVKRHWRLACVCALAFAHAVCADDLKGPILPPDEGPPKLSKLAEKEETAVWSAVKPATGTRRLEAGGRQ